MKRASLLDLDADLQRRRDALADLSGVAAEVEALTTKRDKVLTEWAGLEATCDGVRAMVAAFSTSAEPGNAARVLGKSVNLTTLQTGQAYIRRRNDPSARKIKAGKAAAQQRRCVRPNLQCRLDR